MLTFHVNSMPSRIRQHYGIKGRVIRLHQDTVSGFDEGHEVKDGTNDPCDVSEVMVSDAFARVPCGPEGLDYDLWRV